MPENVVLNPVIEIHGNLKKPSFIKSVINPTPVITAVLNQSNIRQIDYESLVNKPSINGVELIGDKTSSELHIQAEFPADGSIGDLLMKTSNTGVGWVTPASSAEQDNTRPITAAAVYTEIGNINALLATI